jgi:uncharacterized protein
MNGGRGTGGTSELDRLPPMANYVVGFLRRPDPRPQVSADEGERLQEAHLGYLRQLRERGELILTGPFLEATDLRGLLVFRTRSVDRARELMTDDPLVRGGHLVLDLLTWYTVAALAGLEAPSSAPGEGPLTFETD